MFRAGAVTGDAGRPNAWLKPWIDNRNRSDIRYDDDYVMRRCMDE